MFMSMTGFRTLASSLLLVLVATLPCRADSLAMPAPVEEAEPSTVLPEPEPEAMPEEAPTVLPEPEAMPEAEAPSSAETTETTSMPAKAAVPIAVNLPGRGMSMEKVRVEFGEPNQVADSVGEPPITRWVYDNFTVYFENQFVIHAVARQAP